MGGKGDRRREKRGIKRRFVLVGVWSEKGGERGLIRHDDFSEIIIMIIFFSDMFLES